MAGDNRRSKRRTPDVKAPLAVSAVLGLVAFGIASVVGAGGTEGGLRLDLGLIIGGIAFIASVVVCATLMLLEKPNAEELGQGTGVNRSSAKLYAENKARRQAEQARGEGSGTTSSGTGGAAGAATTDEPQFGQRVRPDTKGEEPGSSAR